MAERPRTYKHIRSQVESARKKKEKEEVNKARRLALMSIAGLGVVAGANFGLNAFLNRGRETSRPPEQPFTPATRPETPLVASERFAQAASTYRTLFGSLTRDQVLFIDEYGIAIGGPRDALITAHEEGGVQIAQRWLDLQRAEICAVQERKVYCNTENDIPRQINVIGHLRGENPGTTYVDIVARNGLQTVLPLPGIPEPQSGTGLTRIEYVHAHVADTMDIESPIVKEELSRLAPALIANESTFHNAVTSEAGAGRAVQAMPATRNEFGYTEEDLLYLRHQVAFMGKLFSSHYKELKRTLPQEIETIKRGYFMGDSDAFERDFMVPMTINAYNAGPARMQQVVTWFLQKYPNREAFQATHGTYPGSTGKDLFVTITQEAYFTRAVDRYGTDASSYYIKIEGLAEEMTARGLYS